jgi:hypothetical protein
MKDRLRTRFWAEPCLGTISGILFCSASSGRTRSRRSPADPDRDSGSREVWIAVAIVTVIFVVLARAEWRRGRERATSGPARPGDPVRFSAGTLPEKVPGQRTRLFCRPTRGRSVVRSCTSSVMVILNLSGGGHDD